MIREMVIEDVPFIANMGPGAFNESPYFDSKDFDLESFTVALLRVVASDCEKIFVLDIDGVPKGFLKCYVGKPSLFSFTALFEEMFYIVPEHRGAGVARELLQTATEWAKTQNATVVFAAINTGVESNVDLLFKAMGFNTVGSNYVKRI